MMQAKAIPIKLARSTARPSDFLLKSKGAALPYSPFIVQYRFNYLFGRLLDHISVSINESDYGIGRGFDSFYQIGIYDKFRTPETSNFNHISLHLSGKG